MLAKQEPKRKADRKRLGTTSQGSNKRAKKPAPPSPSGLLLVKKAVQDQNISPVQPPTPNINDELRDVQTNKFDFRGGANIWELLRDMHCHVLHTRTNPRRLFSNVDCPSTFEPKKEVKLFYNCFFSWISPSPTPNTFSLCHWIPCRVC